MFAHRFKKFSVNACAVGDNTRDHANRLCVYNPCTDVRMQHRFSTNEIDFFNSLVRKFIEQLTPIAFGHGRCSHEVFKSSIAKSACIVAGLEAMPVYCLRYVLFFCFIRHSSRSSLFLVDDTGC